MGAFPFDPSWFDALPYCEAGVSANGCEASTGWSRIASATAASGFDRVASGVEGHRLGILIYGIGAAAQTSWTGGPGFLCTTTPTQRMQPVNTGGTLGQCDGEIRTDFNAFLAAKPNALGNPFAPGDTVFAQAWYRNPSTPKTTTLSNGLQFPVGP